MTHELPIEHLSYDDIRVEADGFLGRYHPSRQIPTPIEEIVDFEFRIDIAPFPSLRRLYRADAFITTDMSTIFVDEQVYFDVPNRYRFSLAHESGHAVLHQKVYRALADRGLAFIDIPSWQAALASISKDDQFWIEWQAYAFAGLVLVPPKPLKDEFAKACAGSAILDACFSGGATFISASGCARAPGLSWLCRLKDHPSGGSPELDNRKMSATFVVAHGEC